MAHVWKYLNNLTVCCCSFYLFFFSFKVWFQNQRAKVKKIQNKARQEGGKSKEDNSQGDCDGSDTKSIMKVKDEAHSKSPVFFCYLSQHEVSICQPIIKQIIYI